VTLILAEIASRDWTWERLASESGLSYRTVEELLRPSGTRRMTLASAVRIARAFGWNYERLAPPSIARSERNGR